MKNDDNDIVLVDVDLPDSHHGTIVARQLDELVGPKLLIGASANTVSLAGVNTSINNGSWDEQHFLLIIDLAQVIIHSITNQNPGITMLFHSKYKTIVRVEPCINHIAEVFAFRNCFHDMGGCLHMNVHMGHLGLGILESCDLAGMLHLKELVLVAAILKLALKRRRRSSSRLLGGGSSSKSWLKWELAAIGIAHVVQRN